MDPLSLLIFVFAALLMLELNGWIYSPGCPACGARRRHHKSCPNREADEW